MYELTSGVTVKGRILFKGSDVTNWSDVYQLRRQMGMVFQKPCVFPKSIYENVIFGLNYLNSNWKEKYSSIVEEKLREV